MEKEKLSSEYNEEVVEVDVEDEEEVKKDE